MAIEFTHTAWDDAEIEADVARRSGGSRGHLYNTADEFFPGEPIGAPPRRRSRIKTLVILITFAAAGWGLWQTTATWRPWVTTLSNRVMAEWERRKATTAPAPAALASPQTAPQPIEPLSLTKEVAAVSGTALNPPGADPVTPAKTPVEETQLQDPPQTLRPAPLPKPQIDPTDPFQKRAAAIGLHPQISQAVLSSLSGADYRNARTAIRKALAETSDKEKFIWPLKPESKAAVFQVHFVTGDRDDCRRYIVTVLKNGWTTTAPPMEKCGLTPPRRSADAGRAAQRRPM